MMPSMFLARPSSVAIVLAEAMILLAATAHDAAAVDPWPGNSGTEIGGMDGGGLPSGYEPSGAVWHPGLAQLLIVGDDGDVTKMDLDGSNQVAWSPGGDLEAITITGPFANLAYLGRERPDAILEFDLQTGLLSGNSWDLTPWMTSSSNKGLEALTYVDGLFYAGLQETGTIYVFELLAGGAVDFITTIPSPDGRTDLSGLHYDDVTQILFAIYDTSNEILEMTSDGTLLRAYVLPGDHQEGVALTRDCGSGVAKVFISEDSGDVWHYADYPLGCPVAAVPAFPQQAVLVAYVAILLVLGLRQRRRSKASRMWLCARLRREIANGFAD
jgi:hypothetical protein